MNKQKRADLLLVMVTFFLGRQLLSDESLSDRPAADEPQRLPVPLGLCGARRRVPQAPAPHQRATLCYTLLVGLALTGTYVAYGYGVSRTSVSNAAFICALPVVVTPIFDFSSAHKKPGRRLLFSLAICTAGLALMTLNDGLRPASGDLILPDRRCATLSICC